MQLFIDSYGAFLGTRDGMFYLRLRAAENRFFPIRIVKAILLSQGTSVSTNAMRLAIENSIPIILLDKLEHPIGQVWSGQFGSIATIRKNQALWSTDVQGINWIRKVMMLKLDGQLKLLGRVAAPIYDLDKEIIQLERTHQKFSRWKFQGESLDRIAATFRGWEGNASRHYFRAIAQLLPAPFYFEQRSRRPAFDPFNALLNYLYGFLYAQVELSLMKAGLDPYTGVLHVDGYKRPTLVFDKIEMYRHWADEVAITLCRSGQVNAADFSATTIQDGFYLRSSGKGAVVKAMLDHLNERVLLNEKKRSRSVQVDLDAKALAQQLKNFNPLHPLNGTKKC